MAKFSGMFERPFGGSFATIRGYAKFKELQECSEANTEYQRKTDHDHLDEITRFYESKTNLFFTELVFSLELKYSESLPAREGRIKELAKRRSFRSNIDGLYIKVSAERYAKDWAHPATVWIPKGSGKLLGRIDGNHRMKATIPDDLKEWLVPFCFVLFEKGMKEIPEKMLFYNINSKAKPLTSEEILKAIIDYPNHFDDTALAISPFGPSFLHTRKLLLLNPFDVLTNIPVIESSGSGGIERRREFIKGVYDLLSHEKTLPEDVEVMTALSDLNSFLERHKDFTFCKCIGLFQAYVYYFLTNKCSFERFKVWIKENHLHKLRFSTCHELKEIFETIMKNIDSTIFIAMPFYTTTNKTYVVVKAIIDELNKKYKKDGLDLVLHPLRIDKKLIGHTYDIVDEIVKHIDECGLMIADLTFGNKNVYYEIGYKMGLEQTRGNKHNNLICFRVEIPKNYPNPTQETDIGFDVKHLNYINAPNYKELKAKLSKQILIRYHLAEVETE